VKSSGIKYQNKQITKTNMLPVICRKSVEGKIARGFLKNRCKMYSMYFLGGVTVGAFSFVYVNSGVLFVSHEIYIENTKAVTIEAVPKEWKQATFTAYTKGDGFTPSDTMASGKKVYVGAVACPRSLSLGTVIEVQGKKYTCEDRKAIRFDNEFDIYMQTRSEAIAFGRKTLDYNIVK